MVSATADHRWITRYGSRRSPGRRYFVRYRIEMAGTLALCRPLRSSRRTLPDDRLAPGRASLCRSQMPAQDSAERLPPKQGRQAWEVREDLQEQLPEEDRRGCSSRRMDNPRAGIWTRDAGCRQRAADAGSRQRRRRRILQGVHLRRQQGELTGYSFQIRLLGCGVLRERRQHIGVLLLRRLNVPQSRPDDWIRYEDWSRYGDWSRDRQRKCSDAIELRRRGSPEVRQGDRRRSAKRCACVPAGSIHRNPAKNWRRRHQSK